MWRMGRQPFRGSVAVAAGLLSATELRTSKWRRIFTDVYVDARVKDSRLLRIQAAALLIANDAIITGRSAAFLWGVKMGSIEDPIEVLSPTRARPSGLVIHTGSISPDEIVTRFGVPIPSLPHTAWEIARHLPTLDAVPWIDYLARLRRIETTELLAHAAGHRGEWVAVRRRRRFDSVIGVPNPRRNRSSG